ncbi:MAG: hypothetical protein R3D00_16730 [Bacteroidia bacterium]
MKLFLKFLFTVTFGLIGLSAFSQDDKATRINFSDEDNLLIQSLALYPDATIKVILEATMQPDALVRIGSVRKNTESQFRKIIAPFNQDVQAQFYELARYPDLVSALVLDGKQSKLDIMAILAGFPEDIHADALDLGRKRYKELVEIHQLLETANQSFHAIADEYPYEEKLALEQLVQMPDVLDILMNNFQATVALGGMYRRDPDRVWYLADSVQTEVANERVRELADWKTDLENDPEAQQELQAAAANFADENGYDSRTYRAPLNENDFYHQYPMPYPSYSYWFGYPWWYSHAMWYPLPYWYYWGFYYGPGGQMVIYDLPSWYFLDWYFSTSYNHYYYPHLSHRYLTHYEHHRTSTLSATSRIRDWSEQNRFASSGDWLQNDPNRVERLRDFGARDANHQVRQLPDTRPRSNPVYTRPAENRQVFTRPNDSRQAQPSVTPPVRRDIRRDPAINRAPEHQEQILKQRVPSRVGEPGISQPRPTAPPRTVTPQRQTPVIKKRN